MSTLTNRALTVGTERLAGWADLLDKINVFPVADGDTGRNLVLTLTPLIQSRPSEDLVDRLLMSARGNSGNIAARFLSGLIEARSWETLRDAATRGRDLAWSAVPDPRVGTMLSVFDSFCEALETAAPSGLDDVVLESVIHGLQDTVMETTEKLPKLQKAGVVDSGALGMFLFLEGYLIALAESELPFTSLTEAFRDRLEISASWRDEEAEEGCCIDAVLDTDDPGGNLAERLGEIGESVVVMEHGDRVKVHLHAPSVEEARARMAAFGEVVSFASDDLTQQRDRFSEVRPEPVLHVVTDGAGSVTREDADRLGFTLLDSYINLGKRTIPETQLDASELYEAMRAGVPVSTSQASTFERHQHYDKILSLRSRALYLCVGSVYTGNYSTLLEWKRGADPDDRLVVIDTGAASGRLGMAALATAEYSLVAEDPEDVVLFAKAAVDASREYIFLERLEYLARGGRLSKTKAFFGDMLKKKPVVSPQPEGAEKVAVLGSREEQVAWAMDRLERETALTGKVLVFLEYTDNEDWVKDLAEVVRNSRPEALVRIQRFSLTSGAHMGPGTWGLGFLTLPGP